MVRKNPWSIALEQLSKLPVMDPYNAFYLLNPSGDLSNTQSAFEDWFKNQQGWQVRYVAAKFYCFQIFFILKFLLTPIYLALQVDS